MKIPLSDIKLATDDFSATYKVASYKYRAQLEHFHKQDHSSFVEGKNKGEHPKRRSTVIIIRYPSGHDLYKEERFFTEIKILTSVQHPNIVTLLGFCVEDSEMILVTENVSNGYLGDYLEQHSDRGILTWEKRLKICIDVAHTLNYLHSGMEDKRMIISRDINCYNIGLDENWGPKMFEFGRCVILPPNQDDKALYLNWNGRHFHTDPEYKMTSKLNRKSDVYSFGVVLFEAYDPVYKEKSEFGLADVARQNFNTGTLEDMIDPILKEETGENSFFLNRGLNKDSLRKFIETAYHCVAETQDQRPTMKVVVKELENALLFQKNKDNPRISLEDIRLATNNFHASNCIGEGGFGKVFKGTLQDGDGVKTIVAKRILDTTSGQGEHQFLNELQILLEYKHKNVIGLVGYCYEKDENIEKD